MTHRITLKLIFAVAIVSVVIIGIFAFFIVRSHHRELISRVEHSANQVSETIKSSTRYAMLLNRRDHLHRIINTIGIPGPGCAAPPAKYSPARSLRRLAGLKAPVNLPWLAKP